jgi:hypothetical protein
MKHIRHTLLLALTSSVITLTALPCGPDFPFAIFVLQTGPGGNYASYAAGKIGVPQTAYRTRHLAIAYDYLNGHPLPPEVQKEAVTVNTYLLDPWQADNSDRPSDGFSGWISERANFGKVDGYIPDAKLVTERSVPGRDYDSFKNCLDDAFATAARTLMARAGAHTAQDPAVADWVRAQDAVFTNCGNGKVLNYFGPPGKAPAPPPTPHPPVATPADAPRWLKQDRAYQLAAASFYHLDFDDALTRFRAIAADGSSPWSMTARYLIARTYIRKAAIEDADLISGRNNNHRDEAAAVKYSATMTLAQRELLAMRSEPRMPSMRGAVDGLLDYVNIRLQPDAQAAVLADRLQSPNPVTFPQAVLDLTWLHSTHDLGDAPVPALNSTRHPNDMLAWIDALYGKDEAAALRYWNSSHSIVWLVAALINAKPGDPGTPELLRAAKSVSQNSPGWLTVTYNRLRLTPQDRATRSEVLALLPQIRTSGDVSTLNLFLAMSSATAPSLDAWLTAAPRIPAGVSSDENSEEVLPNTISSSNEIVRGTQPASVEDECGKKYSANTILPLFDRDVAVTLNRDMSLRLLAQAAESSALPENLRFQVAQATWARAVILEKPEIAHRMTPILSACRAAWKPILTAYDTAPTADARQAAGLLALMRFASTVPSVWEGEGRREGFATYDEFRENWWCTAVPKPGDTVDVDPDPPIRSPGYAVTTSSKVGAPEPSFLSPDDLSEARVEVAALERVPRASTYFAQHALAWQRLHPSDPQTPEILGEADRVVRNSCRKEPPFDEHGKTQIDPTDMTLTTNLAKALFETLHRNYPDSVWAKRYKSWE